MRRTLIGIVSLALALSVAGCGSDGSDTNGSEPAAEQSELAVRVEVSPETAVVSMTDDELDVVFTVTNAGKQADAYDLEFADTFGILTADIPPTVELNPGETEEFSVPFTFEGGGNIEGTWDMRLTATSQEDPQVTDEAICSMSFE